MRQDGDAEAGAARPAGCAFELEDAPPPPRPWWCFPLLAAAVLAVSSAGAVFQKMPDVPPVTLAAWRLQLTTLILLAGAAPQWRAMPAADRRRALSRPDALWTCFSGACLAAHFGAWVASLKATSLPHSLLLVSMAPVLLVCLALAQRQPISAGEVGGTLLALAGAVVLAAGAATGREGAEVTLRGDALAFAAAVAVVGYLQVGSRLRQYQPAFVYAAPVTGLAAAALTLTALVAEARGSLVGGDRHGVFGWVASRAYAPFVIWLGTVSGIVGHTGFNTLLKYLSSLTISLAIQLEPLFGPVIGWAIGVASAPSPATWAGGAAVLAATCVVLASAARRQAAEAAGRARRARSGAAEGWGDGGGGGGEGGGGGVELAGGWGAGGEPAGAAVHAREQARAGGGGGLGTAATAAAEEEGGGETARLLRGGPSSA
ncbi:drug Metabolite transporter superfamily [Raphidocelis subcapitata]|uniref:Drug Metabolite transporter superfamily n=1 Tax=Raphidocelis subcapitata TaxID=307507 RepID=A0A2V0PJ34_9CHLO|nr:drug Metabolite transporter superfamily [Raphidocelis subcapitata]|eukprot:GBF99716.1 drug Metabolite transporter superfamily [Raphidocelis subcapitata]